MKKIIGFMLAGSTALLATNTFAEQFNTEQMRQDFYIGADVARSTLNLKNNYGKNIFPHNHNEMTLFVGTKVTENFGVELGYTEQFKKKRDAARTSEGEHYPGDPVPYGAGVFSIENTEINGKHPYLGVFVTQPLQEKFSIAALVGASLSKIKARVETTADNLGPFSRIRTFEKTKLVPVMKLSASYKVNSRVAVHAFGLWRNLAQFKLKSKENPTGATEIRLKNNFSYGLGISVNPF